MESGLLKVFEGDVPASFGDFLSRSMFDQLIEIDLNEGHARCLHQVEGKYFGIVSEGSHSSLFEMYLEHMVHPDDRQTFTHLMEPATLGQRLLDSDTPGVLTEQFRYKLQDGTWRWVEQCVIGNGMHDLPEGVAYCYVYDIDSMRARELGLRSSPHYTSGNDLDKKTGLIREGAFLARIESFLAQDPLAPWCLIAIDIEHFKLFNVWYGRGKGDELLKELGARIGDEAKRAGGLAGYLGLDDFCLLVRYDRFAVDVLFDDLHGIVSSYGVTAGFTPVFGICMIGNQDNGFDCLDQALIAAAHAKADFRKNVCVYEPSMKERSEKEYRILVDFLHALNSGEIFFQLQPQCHMSSGKIVGAEALARWRKDDGTMISPGEFIPALEHNGFITTLDCSIWEQVCIWLRTWIDAGHTPVPVSLNVSQADFYAIDVPQYFGKLVKQYDLSPSLLKIEVTESAYVENAAVLSAAIDELRSMGFVAIMDDFGSGYSSLNALRHLSVDVIKLDAQFLWVGEDVQHKGVHILESVISMAKSLGLPIVCEGVETEDQTEFLKSQGCRYVQGFNFYRPMNVTDFEMAITRGDSIDTRGFFSKSNEQFRTRELFDDNVYSDAMLNNILGPVVLISWDGENANITRFNEQFSEVVDASERGIVLDGVQRLMTQGQADKLARLLAEAEEHELVGSTGMLEFRLEGGVPRRFLLRFFYLGDAGRYKRFYGALQDVTELTMLQEQVKLISKYSSDTIVFMRDRDGGYRYDVTAHGLAELMGLSAEEVEREFNDGTILQRVDLETLATMRSYVAESQSSLLRFSLENARGEQVRIVMKADVIDDSTTDVIRILDFRPE